MTNFSGVSRNELRSLATHSMNPQIAIAARDEIVRRELNHETTTRQGRRKMGNDRQVQFDE